jgi:hypothetical protein
VDGRLAHNDHMPRNVSRRRFVNGSIRLALVAPLVPLAPLEAFAQSPLRIGSPDRRTLRAVADVLIPAQDRMPAASAVGAVVYIERVAGADAKIGGLLVDGLRSVESYAQTTHGARFDLLAADLQTEIVARVEKTDAPAGFFAALRDLVYEAYYTQPRVMRLVGYSFRSGRRRTAALESFNDQRLTRVRTMPTLYRSVVP